MHFLKISSSGLLLLVSTLALSPNSRAQSSRPSSASLAVESERAIVRSQENLLKAGSLMREAKEKQSQKNLKGAYEDATESISMAPSGLVASRDRSALVADYSSITLAYARQLIIDGVFTDTIAEQNGLRDKDGQPLSAESITKNLLTPSISPGNTAAIRLLSDLEQPEIFNKTVTPKSAAQRDEVTRLLREASGLAQSGRNQLALTQYEAVLRIDPYNSAARKGMESINNTTIKYADEAYNETRSRMLWQVEKAWERPLRKSKRGRSTESSSEKRDEKGTDQIIAKLNTIIIPSIDWTKTPISEAVDFLRQKTRDQDPLKKGVNISLKLDTQPATITGPTIPGSTAQASTPTSPITESDVTLSLSNVPLYDVLNYICKLSNLKLKIKPYAVDIVPINELTENLYDSIFNVPPNFCPQAQESPSQIQAGLPQTSTVGAPKLTKRVDILPYLKDAGIEFPPGASVTYRASTGKLFVRNTRDNIDQIAALVDASKGGGELTQIEIQTKFLEINQNNLQELGFSWLLGPFNIGGGVYGSGGGAASAVNSANYPFGNPMAGGAAMSPVGALRSGNSAISGNSVDAVLAGQAGLTDTVAPGIFSIGGVFSDPQFQLVIRALNQKKGVDLMAAPKVTTKSGETGTVQIISEFIYPKSYDPPTIPQSTTNSGSIINSTPPTITPAFPREFATENLGVTLKVTPTLNADQYTIDMDLSPKVVDFDGFINYGSPINTVGYVRNISGAGTSFIPFPQQLTTNTINQPVFSRRQVNTIVTVWDGETVALGGLIREDVQKVQDKVPFLGDMPLAGRLFRSDVDQKIKKNLVIFVTPRILDAEGQPRRADPEEPEIVSPLGLPKDLPQPSTPTVRVK